MTDSTIAVLDIDGTLQPHPTLPEGRQRPPGTAMGVGPTAYLPFQNWLRHDPGDPN